MVRTSRIFGIQTGRTLEVPTKRLALTENAIPSVFRDYPRYLSQNRISRPSPDERRKLFEEKHLSKALINSLTDHEQFKNSRMVTSLDCIKKIMNNIDKFFWNYVSYDSDFILICHLDSNLPPNVTKCIRINSDLSICIYLEKFLLTNSKKYNIAEKISTIDEFEDILSKLKDWKINSENKSQSKIELAIESIRSSNEFDNSENLKFICEQLDLHIKIMPTYSPDFLIFSSLFYNCSPACYNFVRNYGNIKLPSHTTIKRLNSSLGAECSSDSSDDFLLYIKKKVCHLTNDDKIVNLMIDEIHIKPCLDYKGGSIIGKSFNDRQPATSAHVFMIRSIKTRFKDVIHVLPAKKMQAEIINRMIVNIVKELYKIGITTVCVTSDNNSINRKAMSLLSSPPKLSIVYPNPAIPNKPLFYIFDAVHLLKCIRNNWLNQKDNEKTMIFPNFGKFGTSPTHNVNIASFSSLRKLHSVEEQSILKHAKYLSIKALYPSSIERQNVKLALQVFNEHVISALRTIGVKKSIDKSLETASFIEIILKWWTVTNVQTNFKGIRLNNELAKPLSVDDCRSQFLYDFLDWLDLWNNVANNAGKLSKETFTALKHTSHALIEICRYCKDEFNMNHILTSNFQTDALESRFGLYRRLCGTVYNISARQLFECENKLRIKSLLKLQLPFSKGVVKFDEMSKYDTELINPSETCELELFIKVSPEDIEACSDYLPVVAYIAGYCCYSILRKYKCEQCKTHLVKTELEELPDVNHFSFINNIDRGRLLYPNDISVNIVLYSYIVVSKLTKDENFLAMHNQRQVAHRTIIDCLLENEVSFSSEFCDNGHSLCKISKLIVWKSCNVLLSNFCKQVNSKISSRSSRKIATFS